MKLFASIAFITLLIATLSVTVVLTLVIAAGKTRQEVLGSRTTSEDKSQSQSTSKPPRRQEYVQVPKLVGLTEAEASETAARFGFVLKCRNRYDHDEDFEKVVSQSPTLWSDSYIINVTIEDEGIYSAERQAQERLESARDAKYEAEELASADKNQYLNNLLVQVADLNRTADTTEEFIGESDSVVSLANQVITESNAVREDAIESLKSKVNSFCDALVQGDLEAAQTLCKADRTQEIISALSGVEDYMVTRTSMDRSDPSYYTFEDDITQIDAEIFFGNTGGPLDGWHTCRFFLNPRGGTKAQIFSVVVASRATENISQISAATSTPESRSPGTDLESTEVNPDENIISDYTSLYVPQEHPPNLKSGYVPLITDFNWGSIYESGPFPQAFPVFELQPVATTREEIRQLVSAMVGNSTIKFTPDSSGDPRGDVFSADSGLITFSYMPYSGSFKWSDNGTRGDIETGLKNWEQERESLVKRKLPDDKHCMDITRAFIEQHGIVIPGLTMTTSPGSSISFDYKGEEISVRADVMVAAESSIQEYEEFKIYIGAQQGPCFPSISARIPRSEKIDDVEGDLTDLTLYGTYEIRNLEEAAEGLKSGNGFVWKQGGLNDEIASVSIVIYNAPVEGNHFVAIPIYKFEGETAVAYTTALKDGPEIEIYFPDPVPPHS